MTEKNKVLLLVCATAFLLALLLQSAWDGRCLQYHADGARWTAAGVYCWRQGVFREYYRLEDLRAKHEGPKVDPTIRPTPNGFGL